jgi:MFS family permease
MQQDPAQDGWRSLLKREWMPTLAVLFGGVLLQSMNVLMLTTVLPSIVGELGGVTMLSWPTSAFLASSIVAASCAGMLAAAVGARTAYCVGVAIFGLGALLCSLAPTMGWIVVGRLIQGFGGGLESAAAYVAVRATFPEAVWSRTIALMSTSWSMSVLLGPLVGGMFARYGNWRGAFVATVAVAGILAVSAFVILTPRTSGRRTPAAGAPAGRVGLICVAIAAMSSASIVELVLAKAGLIVFAIGAPVAMLRLDRVAAAPLLPSDAFSLYTPTGMGLWLALLLCIIQSVANLCAHLPSAPARPRSAAGRLHGRNRLPQMDDRFPGHGRRIRAVAGPAHGGRTGHHGRRPDGHRLASLKFCRNSGPGPGHCRARNGHRSMLAVRRA